MSGIDSFSPISFSPPSVLLSYLSSRLQNFSAGEKSLVSEAKSDVTEFLVVNAGSLNRRDRKSLGQLLGYLDRARGEETWGEMKVFLSTLVL